MKFWDMSESRSLSIISTADDTAPNLILKDFYFFFLKRVVILSQHLRKEAVTNFHRFWFYCPMWISALPTP